MPGEKFKFSADEHRVWESVFPPIKPLAIDGGFSVRRRRPSELYMSKIVRSLAELGVYPVFRTTADGTLVPWDDHHEPQQSWRLDPGIRSLLGNMPEGSDPECNIDAFYHPADLANHFGADPTSWRSWPQGMTGVRRGPRREDVAITVSLDATQIEYLRRREIIKRPKANTTLVSTGGVAFFAAAAIWFWNTADERARIGRLKTKLAVDFHVLRNQAPLPADPTVGDIDTIEVTVPVRVPTVLKVPPRRDLGLPDHPPPSAPSLEEELRQIEARRAEIQRLIESNRVDGGRRRYAEAVDAVRSAFASAKVTLVDLSYPDFDPSKPDLDVSGLIAVTGLIVTLPDGREFAFGSGRVVGGDPDADADRAAFEADPVGYTFGG